MRHALHFLWIFVALLSTIFVSADTWQREYGCPESIKTTIPGGDYVEGNGRAEGRRRFASMAEVHGALASCPAVESLDLRVTLMGCSTWPDRFNFPFFQGGGDRYPNLTTLKLEGYDFLRDPRGWNYYQPWYERAASWLLGGGMQRTIEGKIMGSEQRDKVNLDLWLDAMDWSKIETLSLIDVRTFNPTLVEKMVPHLRSVRDLDLSLNPSNETLSFIMRLSPQSLAHLTQRDFHLPGALHSILTHHGESLQSLTLFSHEVMDRPSPVFNNTEIAYLSSMAPNLRHLSINIHRNGTWPYETFQLLASIPPLRSMDLYLDIASDCRRQKEDRAWRETNDECNGEAQFQRPWVDEKSASEIFKYMREKKVGEELSNLTFWVGDWQRTWDGPLYSPPWIEHRRARVTCSVENKSIEDDWCIVEKGKDYWLDTRVYY